MRSRASRPNFTSLAAMWNYLSILNVLNVRSDQGSADDPHDVAFLHDQQVLAVDLDLGAGPLAEQDAVAGLHFQRVDLTLLVAGAGADGDDLALARLFLGGVGDDDAPGGLFLGLDAADEHAIVQRTECHVNDLSQLVNADWHSRNESASEAHMWRHGVVVNTLRRRFFASGGQQAQPF